METVSLVASIVSVIIGGFAIWLSVTFYRMSSQISEDTKEAAKSISSSVARLESLFDRLYSDTFSMMKDTVSDMRRHIWPEKNYSVEELSRIEEKADEKIQALREQITSELSSVVGEIGKADSKISGIEERLITLIDKAIKQTRRVESETQGEISLTHVINRILALGDRYGEISLGRLFSDSLLRDCPQDYIRHAMLILEAHPTSAYVVRCRA